MQRREVATGLPAIATNSPRIEQVGGHAITVKRKREVLALAQVAGVDAVLSLGMTKSMHVVMLVKAPNGATQKFFMANKTGCRHADKNNLSLLRCFVRENSTTSMAAA